VQFVALNELLDVALADVETETTWKEIVSEKEKYYDQVVYYTFYVVW